MIDVGGYRPGSLADIVGLHARYYARHWGFGLAFEAKVAAEMAEFLTRLAPRRDLFLAAYESGRAVASIAIDATGGGQSGAHLRWFIVGEHAHGQGLGKMLLGRAMEFCDRSGCAQVWLTTFAGLDAARALYERQGFALTEERDVDQWSGGVREQVFERRITARPPV
jgi:GNAT superfamily N-acetyltransferase